MSTPSDSIANDTGNHSPASQDLAHTAGQNMTPSQGDPTTSSTDNEGPSQENAPLSRDVAQQNMSMTESHPTPSARTSNLSHHPSSDPVCLDSSDAVETTPGSSKRASDAGSDVGGVRLSEASPPTQDTYRILHHILCPAGFHCSRPRLFTQAPEFTVADSGDHIVHLDGAPSSAVESLESFTRAEQGLSFIVFRCYDCCSSTASDRSNMVLAKPLDIPCTEHVLVISPTLQHTLARIGRYEPDSDAYMAQLEQLYPGEDELKQPSNTYSMRFFYHHTSALTQELPRAVTPLEKKEIFELSAYNRAYFSRRFQQHPAVVDQERFQSKDIGLLFCPNETLIQCSGGDWQMYVLRSWPKEDPTMTLDCWHWGFAGGSIRRKLVELNVTRPGEDAFSVRSLEVFPSSFATQAELDKLSERGIKSYYLHHRSVEFEQQIAKVRGIRWMVDYYHEFHPTCEEVAFEPKNIKPFDKWPWELPLRGADEDSPFMLMPSRIHAFSMDTMTWDSLRIDEIRSVKWNRKPFESLVLAPATKDMIKTLVLLHASTEGQARRRAATKKQDDIFRQTKGLTLVLDGEPGTGKTLTAESVAEFAQVPLLTLKARDICGMTPQAKGKLYETAISLSKQWRCILLLDGADVLLGEGAAEPETKRVVSDFVRELNAFDGCLILATNRASTVEAILTSRITVTVRYGPPDLASRKCLWQNFIDMASKGSEKLDVEGIQEGMDELAEHEMNGRQIRDVFVAARHVAAFKKEPLSMVHLAQVIEARSHGGT